MSKGGRLLNAGQKKCCKADNARLSVLQRNEGKGQNDKCCQRVGVRISRSFCSSNLLFQCCTSGVKAL